MIRCSKDAKSGYFHENKQPIRGVQMNALAREKRGSVNSVPLSDTREPTGEKHRKSGFTELLVSTEIMLVFSH